jgi:hypothetical protein
LELKISSFVIIKDYSKDTKEREGTKAREVKIPHVCQFDVFFCKTHQDSQNLKTQKAFIP